MVISLDSPLSSPPRSRCDKSTDGLHFVFGRASTKLQSLFPLSVPNESRRNTHHASKSGATSFSRRLSAALEAGNQEMRKYTHQPRCSIVPNFFKFFLVCNGVHIFVDVFVGGMIDVYFLCAWGRVRPSPVTPALTTGCLSRILFW